MWVGRRRRRQTGTLSVLLGLAMLLTGCVLSTKNDRRRAQELADDRYPGLLRAYSARTLFPQSTGSEVSFAVADDPDAVVRLRLDSDARDCDGKPCAQALDTALTAARSAAEDLRSLRAVLEGCGYVLHAVREQRGTVVDPWIKARLTNDGVADVLRELAGCLGEWSGLQPPASTQGAGATPGSVPDSPGAPSPIPSSLTLYIAAPGTSAEAAPRDTDLPGLAELSDRKTLAPLLAGSRYAVTWPVRNGELDQSALAPRLVLPHKERRAYEDAVTEHVGAWLADHLPAAHEPRAHGMTRLTPGRVDQLQGYVLFCDRPHEQAAEPKTPRRGPAARCRGNHAVRVTTDLDGRLVGSPQVVRDVREGNGALRLPAL